MKLERPKNVKEYDQNEIYNCIRIMVKKNSIENKDQKNIQKI